MAGGRAGPAEGLEVARGWPGEQGVEGGRGQANSAGAGAAGRVKEGGRNVVRLVLTNQAEAQARLGAYAWTGALWGAYAWLQERGKLGQQAGEEGGRILCIKKEGFAS